MIINDPILVKIYEDLMKKPDDDFPRRLFADRLIDLDIYIEIYPHHPIYGEDIHKQLDNPTNYYKYGNTALTLNRGFPFAYQGINNEYLWKIIKEYPIQALIIENGLYTPHKRFNKLSSLNEHWKHIKYFKTKEYLLNSSLKNRLKGKEIICLQLHWESQIRLCAYLKHYGLKEFHSYLNFHEGRERVEALGIKWTDQFWKRLEQVIILDPNSI